MGPSSPYFQFGIQPRFAYNWRGGAGGVMPGRMAPASLGSADMVESGLDANWVGYPAFKRTILHQAYRDMGDWPLLRPAGPEPLDPNESALGAIPIWDGLSDNEKTLAMVAAAAGVGWFLFIRKKRGRRR
jgi:hypothetical protein